MTKRQTKSITSAKTYRLAALLAVTAGILFLAPFFGVIVTSVVLAFSFFPLYARLEKRFKKRQNAAVATLLSALLLVVVPLSLVLSATVVQGRTLARDLQLATADLRSDAGGSDQLVIQAIETVESLSGGIVILTETELIEQASVVGVELANGLLRLITSWLANVPAMFTAIILFIYIFLAVLTYYREILEFLRKLNPLDDDVFELYMQKAGAMTNGMVRGQFLIALVQGSIGTLTYAIAGVPYLAFFFLILTFLSIIPLGSGIVSFPVGIILLLSGNVWQGLVVLLGHLLIVGNIDNLLRPILIPRAARLPSALVLIGVFSGLATFGFLGLIIGPVILILLLTTLQVYADKKETVN